MKRTSLFVLALVGVLLGFVGAAQAEIDIGKNLKAEASFSLYVEEDAYQLTGSSLSPEAWQESANPSIKDPTTGYVYGKDEIGLFHPGHNIFHQPRDPYGQRITLPISINLELIYQKPSKQHCGYLKIKIPLDKSVDTIHQYPAYWRYLAEGETYIYGARSHTSRFVPEIGFRRESSDKLEVGLEFHQYHLMFYKGMETYGEPFFLQALGESRPTLWILNLNYWSQYLLPNLGYGLRIPVKGANGVSVSMNYSF